MAVRLCVGDVVLVKPTKDNECIGMIKYVGPIVDQDFMSEYVGIELVQAIPNGHNGTIDGFTYFTTPKRHGFHTKITNVIKKLLNKHLFNEIKELHNFSQKHLKHISKLEALIKKLLKKQQNIATPSKVNVDFTDLSLTHYDNSTHSNYSCQSSLTTYSNATSKNTSLKNIHAHAPKNNKMNTMDVFPATYAVSDSEEYYTEVKAKAKIKEKKASQRKTKSQKQTKNKKTKQKQKAKLKKMRRSQSHEIDENQHTISRSKHRSKMQPLNLRRKRSKSHQQTQMENALKLRSYTTNQNISHVHVQGLCATSATASAMKVMKQSKSVPSSPYNGPVDNRYQTKQSKYVHHNNMYPHVEVMELSNVALQQSNTQVCKQAPNMLMVNRNGYSHSQYGHGHGPHYSDHSQSHSHSHISHSSHANHGNHGNRANSQGFIQTTSGNYHDVHVSGPSTHSHSAASLSPYRVQLASYNEYYRRGSDMMQQPRGTSISPRHGHGYGHGHGHGGNGSNSGNKMYLIQQNGHEIVYQHN